MQNKKKQRFSTEKIRPNYFQLQEIHFGYKDKKGLKVKGQKKRYQVNSKHQKAGLAILILDKTDFETRSIASDICKFKTMSLY